MKKILCSFVALAVLAVQATFAQAQMKPVAAVSLSGYDELVSDVDFLGGVVGQPGAGQMMDGMLRMVTQGQGLKGLDKSKPWGLVVTTNGTDFQPLVFVPIGDVKQFMEGIGPILAQANMAPSDEGDGVYRLALPNGDDVFVRGKDGWAYVSQTKDGELPADPVKLLEGLNTEYDLGIRAFVQNVPESSKQTVLDQFRNLLELAAAQQGGDDEAAAELARKSVDQQMKGLERIFAEANQVTFGLKVDDSAKSVHFDMTVTAVPGTALDREMKQMAEAKTDFAGFLMPEAGVTLNFAAMSSPETIEANLIALQQIKRQAEQAIDEDQNLTSDEAREQVKKVLGQLMDVAEKTVKTGKMDGGAVVVMGDKKLQFAAGAYVMDGPSLDAALKNLIELAKGEPDFNEHATVKMDAEKFNGIQFHQIDVNLPDEDAQKVFGEKLQIFFGTGPNSVYVSFGEGSFDLVKSAIEKSSSQAGKLVLPMQMTVSMAAIAAFIESVDSNDSVRAFADELNKVKGKDRILITARPISDGVTYRFEIEEGILKAVGAMSRSVARGFGGAGAPPGGVPGGF